jgi:hypothetical protein
MIKKEIKLTHPISIKTWSDSQHPITSLLSFAFTEHMTVTSKLKTTITRKIHDSSWNIREATADL